MRFNGLIILLRIPSATMFKCAFRQVIDFQKNKIEQSLKKKMREITGSLSCTVELSTDKLLTPVPPQKVFHKSIFTDLNFVKIDIA
jgi:hypothetical protein